ncbi:MULTISPECIES: hypothetical protein [Nocardia]|uniref:hypothetical protein n=1 Tax=Nocardia TaxID=1817 RepID=UPI001FE21174|nr:MULTISPECIES: hypothetical protein [Nocardia]
MTPLPVAEELEVSNIASCSAYTPVASDAASSLQPDEPTDSRRQAKLPRQRPGSWLLDPETLKRYLVLGHPGAERTAEVVRDSLIAAVTELPATPTAPRLGTRMPRQPSTDPFPMATDIRVFFADPGALRQRGSNERHQWYSAAEPRSPRNSPAVHRKILDCDTPAQRLAALMDAS